MRAHSIEAASQSTRKNASEFWKCNGSEIADEGRRESRERGGRLSRVEEGWMDRGWKDEDKPYGKGTGRIPGPVPMFTVL